MYIIKLLKRKDAASVVVAVVLGLLLLQLLSALTGELSFYLSGAEGLKSIGWREDYIQPGVNFILQVVLLEAFLRVAIFLRPYFVSKKTK